MSAAEISATNPLLNEAGAVAHLAQLGIETSKASLARMRKAGELRFVRARGRSRILYRREDLAAAFLESEETSCPSPFIAGQARKSGTSVELSRDAAFAKARALAKGGTRNKSATASSKKR